MKNWFNKAKRFVADNWRSLLDWYIERERRKQIQRREEMGDL